MCVLRGGRLWFDTGAFHVPSTCCIAELHRITEPHLHPKNVVLELVTVPEISRRVVLRAVCLVCLSPWVQSRAEKQNPQILNIFQES